MTMGNTTTTNIPGGPPPRWIAESAGNEWDNSPDTAIIDGEASAWKVDFRRLRKGDTIEACGSQWNILASMRRPPSFLLKAEKVPSDGKIYILRQNIDARKRGAAQKYLAQSTRVLLEHPELPLQKLVAMDLAEGVTVHEYIDEHSLQEMTDACESYRDRLDLVMATAPLELSTAFTLRANGVIDSDPKPDKFYGGCWGDTEFISYADWKNRPKGDPYTPFFVSPERLHSGKPSAASTVFSVGASMVYLLSTPDSDIADQERQEARKASWGRDLFDVLKLAEVHPDISQDDKSMWQLTQIQQLSDRVLQPKWRDRPESLDQAFDGLDGWMKNEDGLYVPAEARTSPVLPRLRDRILRHLLSLRSTHEEQAE